MYYPRISQHISCAEISPIRNSRSVIVKSNRLQWKRRTEILMPLV